MSYYVVGNVHSEDSNGPEAQDIEKYARLSIEN